MMRTKQTFRDLKAWQRAMDLIVPIYELAKRLPVDERFGLAEQMRRAAISVPANIAEGQARWHPKDFLRHLFIAHGSLAELDTLVLIAERLGTVGSEHVASAAAAITEARMPLSGLIAHLRGQP